MREYVPYKWCYDTLRCLELKPKCRKKNVSTKLVLLETKGVPLVSLLLSVFFFPVFLFLPVLLALPQPPCTQCARVTSFWSFLSFLCIWTLKNKFGCTWRPLQVRPISLVQRKILLPNIFLFILYSTAISQKCLPHKIRS